MVSIRDFYTSQWFRFLFYDFFYEWVTVHFFSKKKPEQKAARWSQFDLEEPLKQMKSTNCFSVHPFEQWKIEDQEQWTNGISYIVIFYWY